MLKKVILTNYRQFTSKEVTFDSALHIIQGRNATGKSTIVEATAYALQGSSMQKGKGGSWVKEGESNGGVDLFVDDIIISRHTNKQIISDLDGNILARGHTGLNEYIERRYKLVPELFKTSFYIGQKDVDSFAGLTSMERTKRVEKLLRIDVLDTIKKEVSDKAKLIKSDIAGINAKLANAIFSEETITQLTASVTKMEHQLATLKEELTTLERKDAIYKEALARWNKMLQAKAKLDKRTKVELDEAIESLNLEISKALAAEETNRLYMEKTKLEKKLEGISINEKYFTLSITQIMNHKMSVETNKKLEKRLESLAGTNPVLHEDLEELKLSLSVAKHDLKTLEDSPDTCKTCGQKMPDMKDRAKRIKELKEKVSQLEVLFSTASLEHEHAELLSQLKPLELTLEDPIETVLSIVEAKPYYDRLKEIGEVVLVDVEPVEVLNQKLQKARDGLTSLAIFEEYSDCIEEPEKVDLTAIRKQVTSTEQLAKNYQEDLNKQLQAKAVYDTYKNDLIDKENIVLVYAKLIKFIDSYRKEFSENIIPLLSDNVTKIMSYLTEGKYEKVIIGKDYSIENYDMLSGSEEDSVNFALRLAIAQISRLGDFNTMMLDEIAASFDSVKEALLLDILKSTDMQLIYISHGQLDN